MTLKSINSNSGDSSFKTTISTISKSISNTSNNEKNIIFSTTTNTVDSTSLFRICKKFRDSTTNNNKTNSNVKKEKLLAKVSNTKRIEVNGRIAFGDITASSLFFQAKHINTSTNSNTTDKALSVASSALTKGRDAAFEKMKAWGEEWAEEEELEDAFLVNGISKPSPSSDDNSHRQYQRDTTLAMTRVNKLKTEKRKSSMYR